MTMTGHPTYPLAAIKCWFCNFIHGPKIYCHQVRSASGDAKQIMITAGGPDGLAPQPGEGDNLPTLDPSRPQGIFFYIFLQNSTKQGLENSTKKMYNFLEGLKILQKKMQNEKMQNSQDFCRIIYIFDFCNVENTITTSLFECILGQKTSKFPACGGPFNCCRILRNLIF